ncbi:hypothetical protein CCZ20_24540 [Priestia aryabhattai]|uniref:AbrB/MazE/SpoVT family DNA-binding domain-containing protein n=1 Tax=Priestia aryabhattai TaxID=412384 RepID=UPI000B50F294|nr:AbrB/MazE/SpoVT family DNA-binding domain-containing protein [Priestia aryabhattai]OVE34823.1 hypothetical protein CCZ20_24540 [Priestia aryabhattai]
METTGIVRKIDGLGRIVLPKEVRDIQGLDTGTSVEITPTDDGFFVKKYAVSPEKQQLINDVEAVMVSTQNEATKRLMQNVLYHLDRVKYRG